MNLTNDLAYRFSAANRQKKWQLFLKTVKPDSTDRILDIGFSEEEYSKTDNFIEKHYPYPSMITALGVDTPIEFCERYPEVNAVSYDGHDFPFPDKSFDICWSNAVIEHVGDYSRQLHFLKEIVRVGKRCWITTPNRHFPIEVHTRIPLFHIFSKRTFDTAARFLGKDWATGNYLNLLSKNDIKTLLDEAGISRNRVTITANKLLGFNLDYVVFISNNID